MTGREFDVIFDVIVVGAGSTGATLASRLSDAGRSVLLLEAGTSYDSVDSLPRDILEPNGAPASMPGHPANWAMLGTLFPGMSMPMPRGKIIGGSSSINGCYFVRGLPENFAQWVKDGLDEWAYDKLLPYYKASESDQDFDDEFHGQSGPISVYREPSDRAPVFNDAFTQACKELGYGEQPDKNAPGDGGVGPIPVNIAKGIRVSTAVGYLIPRMGQQNFTIKGGVFVRRVLIEGGRAVGVEAKVDGKVVEYRAGEVVVSAGALRSPHLLMLSGVGPAEQLRAAGVAVVADLPGVGQNMRDHPEIIANYNVDVDLPNLNGRGAMGPALHWQSEGSQYPGDLELFPFLANIFAVQGATSAMLKHPVRTLKAMRGISMQAMKVQSAGGSAKGSTVLGLQQSVSRGEVRLVSANPAKNPKIDWHLMREPEDKRRMHELLRVFAEIFRTPAMKSIGGETADLTETDLASPAALDAWIAAHPVIVGHPTSTCRMGLESDREAVVDQYGRVYGVDGLRVADTSIWPTAVSRGPNATAVMTGERIAAFMTEGR